MLLDAVAPTLYFYIKPKGIYWTDAEQKQSGRSRWEQRRVPDEILVYAATDAIMARNILKAIYSRLDTGAEQTSAARREHLPLPAKAFLRHRHPRPSSPSPKP